MLKRVRKALVESFVGAIALGWLWAQGIIHFAYIFIAPLTSWIQKRFYGALLENSTPPKGWLWENALSEAARSLGLLLLGYLLLRWLYFKPLEQEAREAPRLV